ncbi:transglycosylase domain-containing protein [Halalkalibacter suaedae]
MKTKKKILLGIVVGLALILLGLLFYFIILLTGQYVIDEEKLVMKTTTSLVSEDGVLITQLFEENRELVSIQSIPSHVQEAFVAIEDSRFREHQGIDIRSIGRALYRDIVARQAVEGGSTITQQLAKNVFLTNEKTLLRKTKEVAIAMNLERRYSKDEILEMYLNQIYFGHGAYGIQAAAELYFNKDVSELSIEEGALLAGLPKAPNSYSPFNDLNKSKQRRDLVLTVMQRQGYLNAEEMVRLQGKTVAIERAEQQDIEPYLTYIDMVIDEAEQRYHLSNEELLTGGYEIVVPMSPSIQVDSFEKMAQSSYFPAEDQQAEAAFVLMDNHTGGVLAVHGGREYVRRGLNRVNVKRQPGSTLKPLAVYAPALEKGYHPYSLLTDELIEYDGYTPRNYNGEYTGEMTMYDALTYSANAPAVWLLNEIGVQESINSLERFGLDVSDRGLAIALGGLTEGLSPFEIVSSYRVFANEGKKTDPYFITAIYSRSGDRIGEANTSEENVIKPQTAWDITRMLEAVVQEGTGKSGEVQSALAGKTGTTSYTEVSGATRDAWFVGYTPTVVGGVWMGYDTTNESNYFHGGSSYPTILFKDIINDLPSNLTATSFTKPNNVKELETPIALTEINDLTATLAIGGRGLMSIRLNWTGSDDDRIHYTIYEVGKSGRKEIATVVGANEYFIPSLNPFSQKTYEIVPYNTQIDREGVTSNQATVKFQLGFH